MIEHLKGREQALRPLMTGREAEWIALVCLHSGVFHPRSVLSLLRGPAQRGPPDCADIGGTPGGC